MGNEVVMDNSSYSILGALFVGLGFIIYRQYKKNLSLKADLDLSERESKSQQVDGEISEAEDKVEDIQGKIDSDVEEDGDEFWDNY